MLQNDHLTIPKPTRYVNKPLQTRHKRKMADRPFNKHRQYPQQPSYASNIKRGEEEVEETEKRGCRGWIYADDTLESF